MKEVWNKYREIVLYGIFGVLTTLINIITYYILTRWFRLDEYFSNVIAWILSVLFAFITNKVYVFESKDTKIKGVLKEGISFFGFRLVSLGIDMVSMYLFISILRWNDLISKVISNIIVIILNYVFSKLFIFRKK